MIAKTILERTSAGLDDLLPDNLTHKTYLMIAKTRAKALGVAMKVIPMPRPMLYVGKTATQELCEAIAAAGYEHVLIVTDKILNDLGVVDSAAEHLKTHGVKFTVYDGVKPDPTFGVVEKGLKISKKAKCDAVLAIGGGSVIDAAKMIAVSQGNDCKPQKMVGLFKAKKPPIPLYAIPTTAGTGSEATVGAVVSDDKTHQKALVVDQKLVPKATAIDPEIMKGMPPHVTADTGIDVLTHALEAWVSAINDEDSDYYAASAIKSVLKYLPIAYAEGDNLKAREQMGLAAHYAGVALNKAGLGYVHAIAHQLGAYYGVPHGRANAIVLPYILELNAEVSKDRIVELAKKIGAVSDNNASDEQIVEDFIHQVRSLIKDIGINPYVEGMNPADFKAMTRAAAKEVSDTYAVPKYMTKYEIRDILERIQADGEQEHSLSA